MAQVAVNSDTWTKIADAGQTFLFQNTTEHVVLISTPTDSAATPGDGYRLNINDSYSRISGAAEDTLAKLKVPSSIKNTVTQNGWLNV